jgi:nucleoside 2-deoxyribosyltransferase
MKIYLTHPITGLTYDEVMGYYEPTIKRLRDAGWEVLYPMLGKEYLRTTEGALKPAGVNQGVFSTDHAIVKRDNWMVQEADVVYANLEGAERVSIGSCFELAWAHQLGKYVVLVLGWADQIKNPHSHAFVLEAAGAILPSHEAALTYLERLGKGE